MANWPARIVVWLCAVFLAALPLATDASNREPAEDADNTPRIVAVGDLHGDYQAWRTIAGAAKLVDAEGRWVGGKTILVQMGDITDRGPDSLKIIRHLQQLESEALKSGGQVVVLLGNHEAMNVIGDLRYVDPGEYAAFEDRKSKDRREATWRANRELLEAAYAALDPPVGAKEAKAHWFAQTPLGKLEHRRAWAPGGELANWASERLAVAKIGDTLFVHGGLSAERSKEPLGALNSRIAQALLPGEAVDRAVLEDPLGPLWYRGNIVRAAADEGRIPQSEELAQVLANYGATRLVVAHTPSLEGIVTAEQGRLIRVDTGISAYYGGPLSYLELRDGEAIAHQRDPEGTWQARPLPQPELEKIQ